VVLYHVQMRDGFAQWAPFCASNKFNDFFFVLSDFVNAASHGERLAASFSPARFLAWRLGRPYPLHSAMVLAGIVLECLALTAMVLGVAQCAWRWIKEPCCVWSRNNLRVAP
jgi:peptidoglycan/LPS O-acetylase OafA/YrhL